MNPRLAQREKLKTHSSPLVSCHHRTTETLMRTALRLAQLRHENSENDFFHGLAVGKSLVFNGGFANRDVV